MNKHPECEDRCQLKEIKGYPTCGLTGVCAWLEAYREETQESTRFQAFVAAREAEQEKDE